MKVFNTGKSLKRGAYYLFLLFLRKGVLFLPRRLALYVGVILADLAFLIFRKDKLIAVNNLKACYGGYKADESQQQDRKGRKQRKRLKKIARESFRNLGKSAIELMQFPKLTEVELNKIVKIEGEEKLSQALGVGRGVILLSAHVGNWELLGATLARRGYKVNAIATELKNPKLNALIEWHRRLMNLKSIPRNPRIASVKITLEKLKKNELVGILADLDSKVDGVFVDFFGKQAYTAKGAAAIAKRALSPIVPIFIVRQADNSHKIVVEDPVPTSGEVLLDTQRMTKIIEAYVWNYPEQWIWMHQRWKTKPP